MKNMRILDLIKSKLSKEESFKEPISRSVVNQQDKLFHF